MALQNPFEGAGHLKKYSQYALSHDHVVAIAIGPACKCNVPCHIVGIDSRAVHNPNPETRGRGADATKPVKGRLGIWGIWKISAYSNQSGTQIGNCKKCFSGDKKQGFCQKVVGNIFVCSIVAAKAHI